MGIPVKRIVVVLVGVLLVGCGEKVLGCEEAINSLVAKKSGVRLSPGTTASAISSCKDQKYSMEVRRCMAAADTEPALQACLASHPASVIAMARLAGTADGATKWTPARQAALDKMVADHDALLETIAIAFDARLDAKTAAEVELRALELDSATAKRTELEGPIAAARRSKAAAEAAVTAADATRAELCAYHPLLTACR